MGMQLMGVLPVSALNIGVVAGIPALNAQITKLQLDLTKLQAAIEAQLEVSLNIPALPSLAASFSAYLGAIVGMLNPANLITASLDAQADIAAELGLLAVTLELVGEVHASFSAGLDAGGLSLWTYAGRSASFGDSLADHTRTGYPGVGASEEIQALVIATEDFSSWGNFSASFNTGTSSLRELETATTADLTFEGTLRGDQLNTGVLDLMVPVDLFFLELQALQLNLEFALSVSIGLNLPDIDVLLDIAANVDVSLMLDNLINVSVDLALQIELLNLQIGVLLELIADLQVSLSAGGLALWVYSGAASELGTALQGEIADGVPGGNGPDVPAYGCVVASKLPAAWAAFGLIFATG